MIYHTHTCAHLILNTPQVLATLFQVSSVATTNGYTGPSCGVNISAENVREFDQATLDAGKAILGGQTGWNQGATQAGMNIGNTRHITD